MTQKECKLRHIRKEGSSRVIAVTDLLPEHWQFITCKIVATRDSSITIKFEHKS